MRKTRLLILPIAIGLIISSCKTENKGTSSKDAGLKADMAPYSGAAYTPEKDETGFAWQVDKFADLKIVRYQIPGWENLSGDQQKLVYYLNQAGLSGRDIMYDQNYRHNLKIRRALEKIYSSYSGDKGTTGWNAFETYLKRVWFSNGIHHHYSSDKLKPGFSKAYFISFIKINSI